VLEFQHGLGFEGLASDPTNGKPCNGRYLSVHQTTSSFSKQYQLAGGLRFAIAFFIALVGLAGGAREKLAKLNVLHALIAVFLLEFGADTIKNVFTQKNGQPTPSARNERRGGFSVMNRIPNGEPL
jgi:hypothetical protein